MDKGNTLKVLVGIVIVGLLAYAGLRYKKADVEEVKKEERVTPSSASTERAYKDGSYTAMGTYTSPAGKENVEVSLTLANGVVTRADFDGKATNEVSKKLQDKFNEGFSAQVVGKPIDSISLTVVNGASLTPKGFMDALVKIQAEARA